MNLSVQNGQGRYAFFYLTLHTLGTYTRPLIHGSATNPARVRPVAASLVVRKTGQLSHVYYYIS